MSFFIIDYFRKGENPMYNKYQYHQFTDDKGRQVIVAISHYAGHVVKGYAKCSAEDSFDLELGKKIAAARCNKKVLNKKMKHSEQKAKEYAAIAAIASKNADISAQMLQDSIAAYDEANKYLEDIMKDT
jgi:hypothetical protein